MHMTRSPTSPSALALDLSISGSQITMMARRPSSASPGKTGKTFSRSVSVIGETRKHRNTLADSLGGSRSIKNLRRSNSTTQVNHTIGGRHRSDLTCHQTLIVNICDEQPRVLIQPSPRSSSSLDSQSGNKKREAGVCLAATFTANNRSNKGAVGNSVSTILHNNHHNTDKPLTPKSSNQRPSFKYVHSDPTDPSASSAPPDPLFCILCFIQPVLLFIEQVNHAAITIQRWYRLQRQRRQSNQTLNQTHHSQPQPPVQSELHQLLSSKRKVNYHCPLGHGPVSPSEQSRPQSKNTLTELLDSLRLLEEEPCKLQSNKKSYCKDNYTGTQDVDSPSLTADNLQRHVLQSFPPPDGGALLSEAKLQSIMSFLDEMEQSEQERPRSATSGSHKEMLLSEDELLAVEQASATAAELNGNMTRIRLELEDLSTCYRELTVRHIKETEKELNRNFQLQKEQYESTIQRHLAFIDQLISDKKSLSERCEGVVSELKQVDSKYTKKIQQMQEQHDMVWQVLGPLCEEIKKLKELMAATEKVRREKWIDEKTKKIKEITVKPEIQRLISRHKQELNKLRSLHEAELLQADERAALKYIQQTEELRERLEREREALCERERENVKSRYEKQLQEEELSLQQQRRRLYKEVSDEKERLAHLASRQRAELEELRRHLEENSSVASRALREELEKSREEQERRHQLEMKALQERVELERQTWEDTYKTKQEAWLRSQEREMKEELRRERDKEIELAIWTLEEQTSKEREESERAVENRVKRVREKYEAELQELERSERSSVEKHQETRQKLLQREEELMRATSELRLKDQTIQGLKQTCDKLTSERHSLAEVIREEFAERLVQTEEENRQLKTSVSELRARLRLELERVTREKEEELSQVHERVKAAILKKEETVNSLRKQHEAALKRADHLEALWEQQRKQLLEK
uniref:Centrosomal protein 131 n=1 Tax=Periophthalmus magnuspinnatus TaxID=409849 RepID=A0A3B3ZYT0_9GOBI